MWERSPLQPTGEFIQTYRAWDWWITLTFRDIVGGTFALSLFKDWARAVAREIDAHMTVAVGMERQERGAPHFHVLAHMHANADRFDAELGQRLWRERSRRCGDRNDMKPFDPEERGGDYLTKEGGWGILVACPRKPRCRRRGGCKVNAHAW